MIELIPVALIGLVFVVAVLLAVELGNQAEAWNSPSRSRTGNQQRFKEHRGRPHLASASVPQQAELLSLLNGDREAAQRLVNHAKQSMPGQLESWYFDKVISDLLRDRR